MNMLPENETYATDLLRWKTATKKSRSVSAREKLYVDAALAARKLCSQLGVAPERLKPVLFVTSRAFSHYTRMAQTLKDQPESFYRLALLRVAADAITRKCGDPELAQVWWKSPNLGAPFSGHTPFAYVAQPEPTALFTANRAILGMP
jgi:hypothetical protein